MPAHNLSYLLESATLPTLENFMTKTLRAIYSLVAVLVLGVVSVFLNPAVLITSGELAGKQLENSDSGYLFSQTGIAGLSGLNALLLLILLAILIGLWRQELKNLLAKLASLLMLIVCLTVSPKPCQAFFDTNDKTEAYTILPNESAFWIPDVGDNKTSQGKLDSESYLLEKKISVKRFVIPHHKLSNSGGWGGFDKYVPDGRLIIVDRTPFSREWVASNHRGSSSKDESIPCQSKEGINITVGVSIGASVLEDNAAKYLYRFGVIAPQGERTSGEIIFASVYFSRKLAEVMDDVGRKKIQTLICNEIASRSFDKVNADAVEIMAAVSKSAGEYFNTVGITLDFIGWADTFSFDPEIQKAVNDAYIAEKLAGSVQVLQALGQIRVQEGLGKGLGDKGPPVVITPGMIDTILGAVKPLTAGAPPAVPKK